MLTCDLRDDTVQTLVRDFATVDPAEVSAALQTLIDKGLTVLREGQGSRAEPLVNCGLDLRYRGQEFTVTVPLSGIFTAADRDGVAARFHEIHRALYGHAAPDEALELVALRVTVRSPVERDAPPRAADLSRTELGASATPRNRRRIYMGQRFGFLEAPVYDRDELSSGAALEGPAVVEEAASTTVVLPQDRLGVAATGELVIQIAQDTI
jgi:N-methylhydantoinase A